MERPRNTLLQVLALVLFLGYAQAQAPVTEPARKTTPVPTITFSLDWAEANPHYYSITIEATGRASYRSEPLPPPDGEAETPYAYEFTASPQTSNSIFEFARQAKYFKGRFESAARVAQTGTKTLTYQYHDEYEQTSYNYSENAAIQHLTAIFQDIAATMEFGRRLERLYRFERLGLEQELKRMEEMDKYHQLAEVQAIQPILQEIASDQRVINVARQRALRLLKNK